jgi:putative copper export protein
MSRKVMLEIRVLVRAAHIIAAAAWVGGSLMYLVVILPALKLGGPAPAVATRIAALYKRMVNICIGVLLLSGAFLTFDRLTQTILGWPYLLVLGLKIIAALAMFILAMYLGQSNIRRLAKRSTRLSKAAPQLMLALGIVVFLLGALLNSLFEAAIAPH